MSDEESHSESEFNYPEKDEQAKTEQNNCNMTNFATHGDENSSNSQEELQKFVQELGLIVKETAGFDRMAGFFSV